MSGPPDIRFAYLIPVSMLLDYLAFSASAGVLNPRHFDTTWPPPGTEYVTDDASHLGLRILDPDAADPGHVYTISEAELELDMPAWAPGLASAAARWKKAAQSLSVALALPVGAIPVVYEPGKGVLMRWVRCNLIGHLGTGEIFQHHFDLGNAGTDPDPDAGAQQTIGAHVIDAWNDFWTYVDGTTGNVVRSMFPTDVVYTEVGVCVLEQTENTGKDGKGGNMHQKDPTEYVSWATGDRPTGQSAFSSLPYEVACALTLQTARRGPRGRGRLYLPPMTAADSMGANGKFNAAKVLTLAKAYGAFIARCETLLDPLYHVIVSRRGGYYTRVDQVLVGSVPDSQRRRRNAIPELPQVGWTHA